MRTCLAIVGVAGTLICAGFARAEDHLASRGSIEGRLGESAAARERDLQAVDRILCSHQAVSAAAALKVDLSRVREVVPTLSDTELCDVAARTAALHSDPTAGLSGDMNQILVIALIVLIVLLVLKAV